jgi:hypothetical protein
MSFLMSYSIFPLTIPDTFGHLLLLESHLIQGKPVPQLFSIVLGEFDVGLLEATSRSQRRVEKWRGKGAPVRVVRAFGGSPIYRIYLSTYDCI